MVRFLKGLWLALLMSAIFYAAPASAQIGVASVVKQKVSGTIGGRTRVLQVGTNVFQNEIIDTGDTSSAQLLFRDETSLTIGSNAQLVLDRFVYDPRSKSGDVVVSVAKGAFRFVTGSADPRSYKIKTPVATIGVRGTIFEAYIDALGNLFIVVIEGFVDVITATGKTISLKAGEYATVSVTDGVTGPDTWTGPTLNLNAFVRFVLDNLGRLLGGGSDPLPRWNEFNDALDSRDIDVTFPPESDRSTAPKGGSVITPSDVRLKRNIQQLAALENGLRIYAFKYHWEDTIYVGVMAQDLLNHPVYCNSVTAGPSGYFMVDYAQLGLRMTTLDGWHANGIAALTPPFAGE